MQDLDERQADALREKLLERKAVGLCTPKQAQQLVAIGIDPRDLYYDEAKAMLRKHKGKEQQAE